MYLLLSLSCPLPLCPPFALLFQRFALKLEKLPSLPPPLPPTDDGADDDAEREKIAQAHAAAAARAVLKLEAVILSKMQKYPFV